MSDVAVATLGVDVGTARVRAAVAGPDGVVRPVRFDGGVAWLDVGVLVEADGTVVAGPAARRRAVQRPSGWVPHPVGQLTAGVVEVGGAPVEAVDLVAALLRVVRAAASALVGGVPGDVRVVVPASWGPRRRTALRLALHRAGFAQPELVDAATSVGWHLTAGGVRLPPGACVAVCDFGATFEASVVSRTAAGFEVLSAIPAPEAGGGALDTAVAAYLDGLTGTGAPPPGGDAGLVAGAAVQRARLAKEALSAGPNVVVPGPVGAVVFGVPQLREAARPVLAAAVAAIRRAIETADVGVEAVAWVVCIGAGARMPIIADASVAGIGVRPVMVADPEVAAVMGAMQAPLVTQDRPLPAPSIRLADGWGVAMSAVAAVALWVQFVAGTQRYGPRQSIVPGMLLAHWGALAFAAVLAVLAAGTGAAWLTAARHENLGDDRLRRRLSGLALAGGALGGVAAATGFAVMAAGYFDVPAGPLLRWSILPALPVAAGMAVVAAVLVWRPDQVGGSWWSWLRFPRVPVVLAAVGAALIGYDVSGAPRALVVVQWLLEQWVPAPPLQIISPIGRIGGACVGAAVGLLLTRRLWLRVAIMVPLAALTAAALAWRTTGLLAVGFAVVVAGWWLWRGLSVLLRASLLLPPPTTTPSPGSASPPATPAEPSKGAERDDAVRPRALGPAE